MGFYQRNQNPTIIVGGNPILNYDDVVCILNPVKAANLEKVLLLTAEPRRVEVALAFSNMTPREWFEYAGVIQEWEKEKQYMTRWLDKSARLPLGVAFRLAKVLGVSCEVLFEHYA